MDYNTILSKFKLQPTVCLAKVFKSLLSVISLIIFTEVANLVNVKRYVFVETLSGLLNKTMALWNKISSGFDTEDETVNFGVSRTVAESFDSVYETTTLATIEADSEVLENPKVIASIQNSTLCVVVDKSITVFNSTTSQGMRVCIGFDTIITSFCLSKDLSFLFVTSTDGTLYCLNLEADGRLVFFRHVIQDHHKPDEVILNIFLEDSFNDVPDLLLVTSKGHIYRLSGFTEEVMDSVLDVDDVAQLEELTLTVQCSPLFRENNPQEVIFSKIGALDEKQSIVMIRNNLLSIWPSGHSCSLNALPYKYVKVQCFKHTRLLLCLRTDGAINVVCSSTLLAKKVWDGRASDIEIMEDQPDCPIRILILLVAESGSATTFMQLVSFPGFEVKFNLEVPTMTYLVSLDTSSMDEIVFLEGASKTSPVIDTIKVKVVEDKLPEFRMQRLLKRGQYHEAESFAKRFHLSLNAIHCAKATVLSQQLYSVTDYSERTNVLNALFNTLDKIENVEDIFKYCHNTITSDIEHAKQLISYAQHRLMKDAAEKKSDVLIATYLFTLNSTLLRIETYEMIHQTRENTMTYNEDIGSWAQFFKADLFNMCKSYLMNSELKVAALIWVRHCSTLAEFMTTEVVRDMLEIIPDGLVQRDLWPWLLHFVPSVLSVFPDGLSEIVTWGYKRAKLFEKYDPNNWPRNGLNFCKSFIKLLNLDESQSFSLLHQQYTTEHSPLQHLTDIIQALTDLMELKKNHRLIVKIEAYMGEPIEVAHLLLSKVYPQEVGHFVESFLHQYMLNHSLKNDYVLILYIQKTLKSTKEWWYWQEAPWEQKIASVVACIHNVETRLQQVVDILKKASVPWSPTILALVDASSSIKHSLVSTIRNERNSVALKVILKKYGYQHIGVTDILPQYMVKQNRDGWLEDLYEVTKNNHSFKTRAFSFCVNFFLNKGDLMQMMYVLNNLPCDDAAYCCNQVINYISICLRFQEMNNSADYYAEVISSVQDKLRNIPISTLNFDRFMREDILITASELKSICLLRKEFGLVVTLTEYQTEREIILKNYLEQLCNDNKTLSGWTMYKRAGRIADLLRLPRISAICFLLEISRNIEVLKFYIEAVKEVGSFPANECHYVKKLCQIFIFDLKIEELGIIHHLKHMSTSALDNCTIGELSGILLSTVWSNMSSNLTSNPNIDGTEMRNEVADKLKWRLYKIYTDSAMCSNEMILPFFVEAFQLYSSYKWQHTGPIVMVETDCSDRLISLVNKVKAIPKERYNLFLLQILNTLISHCSSITTVKEEIVVAVKPVRDNCLRTLLHRIISARTLDLQSGLSCLYMFSEQESLKWLTSACQTYQTDYSRLRAVADLGYEYCRLSKNDMHINYFTHFRVRHYWERKLHDYGIHHKEIFTSDTKGKQYILERLMRSEIPGFVNLLKEFCADFEFDFDECYILYLDVLLKHWNPKVKVVESNGENELRINEDDITTLQKNCKQVAAMIEDKLAMKNHLATLWPKINFYHYEVFLLIMELLGDNNEQLLNHLCFLQNYFRYGLPTQIECEEWAQLCSENNSLPTIAKWRFPFLPKIDQWKLITPELNLSTYKKWLEVATVLNLQVYVICSVAIKGSVSQVWGLKDESKTRNSSEWVVHLKNPALLEDIKKCIRHMEDQHALYYGMAALYYVVNHTPPGADQAAAAQECYAHAQKWAQASAQSDEAMIEKIKFKYLQLTAKHILYTHGLGSSDYLQLVLSPERLVRRLYMDQSIVLRCRGATENRPDVNSAVNALGKLFSLNIIQLRLELLEEWLQPSDSGSKLDDSITYNIAAITSQTEDNIVNDDNLLRACYLLEWGDKVMSANYLINIGFDMTNDASFRPGIQFRALSVLLSITDSATVQDLTKRDLRSIKLYMKSLQYISKLERLGLTFSMHGFESSPKLELVQMLFRSHAHLPEALVLILQMCLDFGIKDYTLWDGALSAMAKMCMIRELEKILPKLSTVSYTIGCKGYTKAWEVIIWEPFRKTDTVLSSKQFDECVTSICLLHSCPVANKLNLEPIIKVCFETNHPELAAAVLPFLNKNDVDFVVKTISSSCDVFKVTDNLRALLEKGILTVSHSVRILEKLVQSDVTKNE
ncbi:kinetochore-associated protein 1 [Neodiprion pinetum]|uniref:Kinetochore-associated protein 1 n=1 Tax=Neodiprion lecontei TaxID=441921 RepID=A0A6J0C7V5_NEOLC|nr:kinetochore-associated protein 1 [Neodiprion lecontei]XP_046489068.1 kinetochore-associated protein 1 [Neodiprion pinetum]